MTLMKFLKKYKICFISMIFIGIFSSLFQFESECFISDCITCISIIFAFSQSFLLATYTNKDINIYMKEHKMFDQFIKDNRNFICSCLYSLLLLFMICFFSFQCEYKQIIFISSNHIALLVIIVQLNYTLLFAERYMNVYKNSYSHKVLRQKE